MSDGAVELEVNVGGVRLAIAIRVLGGEVVSVREGNSRPQSAQGAREAPRGGSPAYGQRPPANGPAPASHAAPRGRARYGPSIIDPLNEARANFMLEGGRGAHAIAAAMGVDRLSVTAVEEWLDAHPDQDLEGLMRAALAVRDRPRGGR